MTLAEFIAARLDEDEAAAKADSIYFGPYPQSVGEFEGWLVIQEERVLREVAAKRAILALAAVEVAYGREVDYDVRDALDVVLRHLAAVWSDHPDYRQEWKP